MNENTKSACTHCPWTRAISCLSLLVTVFSLFAFFLIAGIEEVKSITFVGDVVPAEEFDKAKAEEVKPVIAPPAPAAAPVKKTTKVKPVKKKTV